MRHKVLEILITEYNKVLYARSRAMFTLYGGWVITTTLGIKALDLDIFYSALVLEIDLNITDPTTILTQKIIDNHQYSVFKELIAHLTYYLQTVSQQTLYVTEAQQSETYLNNIKRYISNALRTA